ncbi:MULTISPECIES: phosphate ABC transporter permease subunit PstC [Moorena]|uniref:Phosphate transport system permease protein n=1 Tax=Moorena producens (strain JHB) TaxID=1454205 RepID=A0A1D9G1U6_MOOP1|nr:MULTISPECIES: phosphate ABC transporter permease subunit PstC [Moorena]NEQ14718.1 phosphate ABC transporter permease subunit PstC [Moorena sp. SIO3E2]AOY81596.1 phosphate ABC transporter permease subunit PstC [Moorena producens JHB]NEP66304.1 phosphate ABC transporter permease subunit PstC [Moorena sp. SIO3A5]NES41322.1 phosphate ABC transporter permease subunit PstC [Moorena sp. SIO2C4]NET63362.1 phosphate ABC transporter permease subunit PstC [Moorena sp. SIO1G6]
MISFGYKNLCPRKIDRFLGWTVRGIASVVGILVVIITGFLIIESLPILDEIGILAFLTDASWSPAQGFYNLTPMLVGTLLVVTGAVVLAAPVGILSALFCHYYAPPFLASFYRRLLELMAGFPGVIYGLWGLVVLVPLINRLHPPGTSLLAGVLMLALLIIPTIALTVDATLAEMNQVYWQGAASLGLSRWGTILGIMLPAARLGVFTGIILGIGRALGETMLVLMVCGNVPQIPDTLFAPIRTLPANIALEMAFALGNHRSSLFVTGLLLLAVSLFLALLAEAIAEEKHIY